MVGFSTQQRVTDGFQVSGALLHGSAEARCMVVDATEWMGMRLLPMITITDELAANTPAQPAPIPLQAELQAVICYVLPSPSQLHLLLLPFKVRPHSLFWSHSSG